MSGAHQCLLINKVGPAQLTGNTLVAKSTPTTPLTTLLFGEWCREILPAGLVNIICDQNELGRPLTGHPDVVKVAFTGSTATGEKIMASAAKGVKPLTLERGGNDAAIVLDDVDPRYVAGRIFQGAMQNSGQICVAIKRAYVQEAIYGVFCDELARLANEAIVDDGSKQVCCARAVRRHSGVSNRARSSNHHCRTVSRQPLSGAACSRDC